MQLSEEFETQLQETFGGRFRVRWSDKRQEFQLEQKVWTGQLMEPPPVNPDAQTLQFDTYSDEWIRHRDGYFYIMAIRNGDRMPCPICGLTVKVPVMETRESICEHCRAHGRDGRYVAAYFPLDHNLIAHIRSIDPLEGGPKRVRDRVRGQQLAKMEREQKDAIDHAEYATIFNKTQVENNPMTGYGPKTRQVENERLVGAL